LCGGILPERREKMSRLTISEKEDSCRKCLWSKVSYFDVLLCSKTDKPCWEVTCTDREKIRKSRKELESFACFVVINGKLKTMPSAEVCRARYAGRFHVFDNKES
jgi:hypothetical protein